MKINHDNYEAYFLDFHEGRLSPPEKEEVMAFIGQNPHLRELFESFEPVVISPDLSVNFNMKDLLKNKGQGASPLTIREENLADYLLKEVEGELSPRELEALEAYIAAHPSAARERKLFALTRLQPDTSLIFTNKSQLKQKAIPAGPVHGNNYEEFLVSELEGTLSKELEVLLEEFLSLNPHLLRDRELFALTRIEADSTIVFPNKSSLKRSVTPVRRIVYYALSAAASVILLLGIYVAIERRGIPTELAQDNTQTDQPAAPKTIMPGTSVPARPEQENPAQIAAEPGIQTAMNNPARGKAAEEQPAGTAPEYTDIQPLAPARSLACTGITSRNSVDPEFMFIRTSQMHMNEYLELYYNLKLAEQVQYAQMNASDRQPQKTVFNALASRIVNLIPGKSRKEESAPDANLSVWTFAELGVKAYNTITNKELELDLVKDDTGNVVSYNLTGGIVDINRDVKKEE